MRFFAGPRLLIIDEVGYLPLPSEAAAALFQVVTQRYLKSSTVLTTNLGVASWGKIFDDPMVAAAMLDRLLHRSVVFNIEGESYRMRNHLVHHSRRRYIRKCPGVLAASSRSQPPASPVCGRTKASVPSRRPRRRWPTGLQMPAPAGPRFAGRGLATEAGSRTPWRGD